MHRALKASLLIALMLGYVFAQTSRSETFCLVTLDTCECDSSQACPPCGETHCHEAPCGSQESEGAEEPSEAPCCLDLTDAIDWFVLEGVRATLEASLIAPVVFPGFGITSFSTLVCSIVRPPDPPPLQGESFRFLKCERILV